MTRQNVLPPVMLVVFATVVPELFSGSTPLLGFAQPGLLLLLMLGYGLPVLLIRELAVRCHSGLAGLLLLGLAYGIFNEGLIAKTVLLETKVPVPAYDHYGRALGIGFPWMAGICVWHAYASVTFPILLVQQFFPQRSAGPWLNGKIGVVLGLLLTLLASVVFLGMSKNGMKGTPGQLAILLALMAVLMFLGTCWKGTLAGGAGASVVGPLLLGFSVIVPFWGLGAVAAAKWPLAFFFALLLAAILFYGRVLKRRGWLAAPAFLFFGLGWYLHNILQALLVISLAEKNPLRAAVTAGVDLLIVLLLFRRLRTRTVARPATSLEDSTHSQGCSQTGRC